MAPTGDFFRQEGIASWYGPQFEGRPTASGEIFNSSHFTAAHPTLPFGTFLLVTNRNNNRQVSVRVNDRGPFVEGRIIDVSQAAAEHLGMIVTGTAPVIIETIPATGQRPPPVQPVIQQPAPVFLPPPVQQLPPPVQQPPPVLVQQPVQPQPQALVQQQEPIRVSTTTIPAEVPPNVPITINIFHTPNDQPPTVVVVPTPTPTTPTPQATYTVSAPPEPAAPVVPIAQAQPERIVLPNPNPVPLAVEPAAQIAPEPAPVEQRIIVQPVPQAIIVEEWPPIQAAQAAPPPQQIVNPPSVVRVPVVTADPNSTYRIQVGSFREPRYAVGTVGRLREAGLEARAYPIPLNGHPFFRVVLEGVRGTEAQATIGRLAVMGFYGVIVTRE